MWRVAILFLLAGCELRGLTRSQLYGPEADAAAAPDDVSAEPDTAADVGTPPADVAVPPDRPVAPPEGIFVTGFIHGTCHGEAVMVGGAGFHTCSYAGKASYRLRLRIPAGTRVEIGAKLEGYLPEPATAVITLVPEGNTQDFTLKPASGSCDSVPDGGTTCVCNADAGCEPS